MDSYTTFDFSHLKVKAEHIESKDTIQATNEKFEGHVDMYDYVVSLPVSSRLESVLIVQYVASVNVTNTGKVDGAAVPQFVSRPKESSEVEI